MQHGSIYGTTYYDAPGSLRDPDQEGLLARGLLGKGQKSGAYNDLLSVVDIAYDWKKEKASIPLVLIFRASITSGMAQMQPRNLQISIFNKINYIFLSFFLTLFLLSWKKRKINTINLAFLT